MSNKSLKPNLHLYFYYALKTQHVAYIWESCNVTHL